MANKISSASRGASQAPTLGEKPSAARSVSKALNNLSTREKVLIWALIIVALIIALLFLLILPANERLAQAQNERGALLIEESSTQMTIAATSTNQSLLEESAARRDEFVLKYQAPLLPEDIDRMLTTVVTECGFTAVSLAMEPLAAENVPAFTIVPTAWGLTQSALLAAVLQGDVSAAGDASGGDAGTSAAVTGGTAESSATTDSAATDAAAEASEAGTAPAPDASGASGTPDEGPLALVYTVQVTAVGCDDSFYAFLDRVGSLSWIKISASTFTPEPLVVTSATTGEQTHTFMVKILINAEASGKSL